MLLLLLLLLLLVVVVVKKEEEKLSVTLPMIHFTLHLRLCVFVYRRCGHLHILPLQRQNQLLHARAPIFSLETF